MTDQEKQQLEAIAVKNPAAFALIMDKLPLDHRMKKQMAKDFQEMLRLGIESKYKMDILNTVYTYITQQSDITFAVIEQIKAGRPVTPLSKARKELDDALYTEYIRRVKDIGLKTMKQIENYQRK